MLRRAASGHIEAMQLSKFAAASRIALAVISGWPEAPSSPLQGGGAPFAGWDGCAAAPGAVWPPFEAEPPKILPRKSSGPPADCACAPPHQTSAAAKIAPPVRPNPVVRVICSTGRAPE